VDSSAASTRDGAILVSEAPPAERPGRVRAGQPAAWHGGRSELFGCYPELLDTLARDLHKDREKDLELAVDHLFDSADWRWR
jgi:hypothetical protein